jgi:hypothetical protein
MFCCDGLKILIDNAGERGMSVLVDEDLGQFRFHLELRAVSKDEETLLSRNQVPLPTKGNITLAASIVASFCPFCGTKLQTLVTRSSRRDFEALAEKHNVFCIGLY